MVHYKRWIVKYKIGREVHYQSIAAPSRKAAKATFLAGNTSAYTYVSAKLQYPEFESASYRRRHLR
jgi:hypothetical protein